MTAPAHVSPTTEVEVIELEEMLEREQCEQCKGLATLKLHVLPCDCRGFSCQPCLDLILEKIERVLAVNPDIAAWHGCGWRGRADEVKFESRPL